MADESSDNSAGARFRAALAAEKPLQVAGAINAYAARLAQATGFRAHLSLRRRRGRQLARHSRPRHQHHGRRADRRPPHHRCLPAAAAGRYRHRLGRRLQHRAHHPPDDQGRRGRRAYRGPGGRQALRPSARQRTGVPRKRWSIASRPPWTRAPIRSLSSWPAPMRWPARAWHAPSSARRLTWPPAPT